MSEPAQGWYPDPSGTPHLRWWNGHSWTNYVMPYAMQNQSVSKPRLPAHNEAVAPRGGQRLGARTAAAPALRAEASAPRDTKAHPPLTAKRGATPSPTTETDSAPSPRPTLTAEATPASSMESTSATSTQDAPKKHTTAHWALACAWSSLSSASSCSRGPTWATPTRSTRMPRRKHGTHKRNATGLNPRSTTSTARSRRPSGEHRPPAPLRATTVAGAILAVIFIALSAAVGGINVWRTHAAEIFTSQAEQAQSDKASINRAIKDAKTRLDSVNVDASAAAWCDSVTRGNASSMRDIIKTYDSSTQAVKDSIHSQCSNKEALANAQRTLSNADFTIAMTECTANKVTTTIKGTLAVKQSSTITMFGPLNVTVIGYTTEKNKSFNPTSPYQGTTTATLTPGTPLTFSVTVPYDPNMTGNTECGATMTAWRPSDM